MRVRRKPGPKALRGGSGLHVFTMPQVQGWEPASTEDAVALAVDLVVSGRAFATPDGRRLVPSSVEIRDGVAYGGEARLPFVGEMR